MPYNIIRVNNTAFNQVKEKVESTLLLPEGFSGAKRIPDIPVSNTFFHITPSGDVSLYSIAILEQNINLVNTKHQQVDAWASQSNQSAIDSAASATLAQKFAENDKDVEVVSGLYSAKHWALVTQDLKNNFTTEAQGYVQTALNHATSAGTFKDQSSAIYDAMVLLADDVDGMRLAAQQSASDASTSETNAANSESAAEGHASDALASKNAAATSATQSASSANTALGYKDDALVARNQAQAARDTASSHSQSASSSATAASTSEANAATSAQSAQTSSVNASAARSAAQTAETSAKQWRDEAEEFRNEAQAIVGGISYNYNDLTNVPTTFTPKAHTHNASDINAGVFNRDRIPAELNTTTFSGQASAIGGGGKMIMLNALQGTEEGELSIQAVQNQRWSAQLRFGSYGAKITNGFNNTLVNLSANLNASELNRGTVPNARLPETATRWPTISEIGAAPTSHGHSNYVVKSSNATLNSLTTNQSATFNGKVTIKDDGTDSLLIMPQTENEYAGITFGTNTGVIQWLLYTTNDASRDLSLQGRDDSGQYQHTTLTVSRSTGDITFKREANFTKPTTFQTMKAAGNFTIEKDNPWLTLDSSSSGANGAEQGAGITIGESGYKGSAAIHMTYTGDGKAWLGMGTVTDSIPANWAMYFNYQNTLVYFRTNPSIAGETNWHAGNDGAGSGLDADLLDGIQASGFLRADQDDSMQRSLQFTYGGAQIIHVNPNDAVSVAQLGFEDNWLRYRLGGSGTTRGIRIDDYDNTVIELSRSQPSKFYLGLDVVNNITVQSGFVSLGGQSPNNLKNSFRVFDNGGNTVYGMALWNTSNTSGEWSTMIFGPNQANRRISFGKVNSSGAPSKFSDITEKVYIDLDNGNIYSNGNVVWHAGNDGAGSGLDADLLDGLHASSFALKPANHTTNNVEYSLVWENNAGTLYKSTGHVQYNPNQRRITTGKYASTVATGTAPFSVNSTTLVNNLNADLLDGLHASKFIRNDISQSINGTLTVMGNLSLRSDIYFEGWRNAGEAGFYVAGNVGEGGRFLIAPRHSDDTNYRWSEEFGWSKNLGWYVESTLYVGNGATINHGGLVVKDSGTIGSSNFDAGWLRIGTAASGLAFDPNEMYFTGEGAVGTFAGDLNLRPAGNVDMTGKTLVYGSGNLKDGGGGRLHINTAHGWLQAGPQNTSYCHFYTDRGKYYFNKSVDVTDALKIYGTSTEIKQYGSMFETESTAKITSGGQLLGAGISIFQGSINGDALTTYHIANNYAVHFGLESTRKRLMVGGWSDGAGSEKDILTRKGLYYNALGSTVTLNYKNTGNHAFVQLWAVNSNNNGRITIGSGYRIGDIIEIANNNPLGTLNIRTASGTIYMPDGSSIGANVDAKITVPGKMTLYNFNGSGWMLSVG